MADKKTLLTANARIFKPDLSGFWEAGDQFDADELSDKGAYLIASGHVTSSEGAPKPKEEDESAKDTEIKGLKIKVGKLESYAKKVNEHVAKLPDDQRKAFEAAMKPKEE